MADMMDDGPDMRDDSEDEREEEQLGLPPQAFIEFATGSQNIAGEMSEGQLNEISQTVISDYKLDKDSMSDWLEKMERGIELANLVKKSKEYPFKGAANVKYPLITSAALQFNARAYPAIVPADRAVKARVWGADPQGAKAARAERVSEHMSYQLTAEIEEWEEETDNLLVQLPIVGTMVRKWWYDPAEGRPRCRLVDPGKFIVNDKVKRLSDAPRCSEELPLYPNEIEQRIRSGDFVEFDYQPDPEDEQGEQKFIEQHTRIDLDEDGYTEPYVVTVHEESETVVRIVADFSVEDVTYVTETTQVEQQVVVPDPVSGEPVQMMQLVPEEIPVKVKSIRRGSYFTAFKFMPSMDGGFHGTGLGLLLGDISDTINSIINMLLDAGHYASLGGGFIGADFRMKGGSQRHRPGEWRKVGANGQDIKRAIVPLTFPGPDATLFEMLGMMIEAGREIASVKDIMTGDEPRQNQTATTTLALIEQGMMVFTAAYKRIFRALKDEYKLLAGINAQTLDQQTYAHFHDEQQEQPAQMPQMGPQQMQDAGAQGGMMPAQIGDNGGPPLDPAQDYDLSDMDIQPVADPRSVTKMQQAAKAQLVMQLAEMGLVDQGEALSRIAEAMDIEDVEDLAPQPDPMQQEMAMLSLQSAKAEVADKMANIQLTMAKIEESRASVYESIRKADNDTARVQLEAKGQRLDGLMEMLEDERKRLELVLSRTGRMEGQSGNGNSAGGNGGGSGASAEALAERILAGSAVGR